MTPQAKLFDASIPPAFCSREAIQFPDLNVYGPGGSVTPITGSRLKRGVNYADTEFTAEGLKQLNAPPGSGSSE